MHITQSKRALGLGLSMLVGASVMIACGNDFDTFAAGAGSGTPDAAVGADGQTTADGSTTNPGTDSSVTPTDGSTPTDGPTDCATKADCGTTRTTCRTMCDSPLPPPPHAA